jgi:hypothetical protein
MKAFMAMIAAATILLAAGVQVFAAEDGRVSDDPSQIQQYLQAHQPVEVQ